MPALKQLPVVPQSLIFMDKDFNSGVIYGRKLLADLKKLGAPVKGNFLDFGCGWGRMTFSLLIDDFKGEYVGIDIMEKRVNWLSMNITPSHPNFRFILSNSKNDRYRKDGEEAKFDVKASVGDLRFSTTFMGSVFTHMYAEDIHHYLSQIASVMKDDGIFIFTCFLIDPFSNAACAAKMGDFTMPHKLDETCRYESESDPLFAIAYDQNAMMGMLKNAGLSPISITYGRWSGRAATEYQDWIVVRKSKA